MASTYGLSAVGRLIEKRSTLTRRKYALISKRQLGKARAVANQINALDKQIGRLAR